MAEDRPNFWTSRRRWAAVAVAGTLAAMAAGHWLPDAGLRWGLVKTLRDLGMSDVALGGADLSLFNGALVVRGVSAKPEGGAGLDLAGLLLDFRWKPLLSKRVSVEALELDGADIELRRTGDGWELNGLPLAGGGEGGSQWSFDADRLRLTASRLTVLDGTTRVAIDLDDLQIDNLRSWDAGQTMRYHLAGKVNGAPLVVDGSATPFADIPAFALTATAEKLDLAPFARAAGLAKLAGKLSGEIALTGKVESARIPLEADGKLSAAGMAVEIDGTRLAGDLAWTGKAHVDGAVKATGKLSADRLTVTAGGATVTAGHAVVEAAKAEWAGGKGSLDGAIAAEAAQYGDADVTVSAQALSWKGKAGLAADGAIASEGSAEATAIAIRTLGRVIEQARAGGTGSLNVVAAAKGVMPPLTGRFDAWAEGVMVREPIRDLAAAERVEAKGVALDAMDGAWVQRLELQSPKALARKGRDGYGWRVEARRIAIERAAMTTEGDLSIGDLRLAAPVARLQRTAKGFAGFASTEPEAADTPLPRVTLARLRIGGGRVEFEDRTPSEAVRLTVDGIDLVARELDTGTPEHDSPFTLKARAGASVLAASGSLRPFAPSFSGKMKGDVKSFELPPLSPYAADSLGVHLHTGQFDGDLSLAVEHGALDGRMDMVLSNLFVAQPDPNAPIAKQADMPVETVLDLLRDSEDRIRLTIPVRGDLSKPDFDVSDAVSQAVGGALKSTVVTTLKVAFPVAALIGYVIDESSASRLSLEPLAFAAGDAALADSHPARLATVADLLRQRPGLKLTLCGAATMAADWPAVLERRRQEELGLLAKLQKLVGVEAKPEDIAPDRDALTALAEGRAQAVKAWLVKNGGIDAGRLFTCRPKVEPNGTGGPRVDLLL